MEKKKAETVKKEAKERKQVNKFLNFIKKNITLSILLLIFILIFILGLVAIKVIIFPSYSTDKYGDRLENIDTVKLTDSRFEEIKTSIESVDGFNIKKFEVSGKIVNIYVDVVDFDVKVSKERAQEIISKFSEEELKYYDFQVFITGNSDSYPVIGYKNKNSESLHWNYEGEN